LPFVLGNIALLIFAFSLGLSRIFKIFTVILGTVALLALPFFFAKVYFGLGFGGMERLVAYPQAVWLIAFGIYMNKDRFREAVANNFKRLEISR
jgi:hypothetical membrane protein